MSQSVITTFHELRDKKLLSLKKEEETRKIRTWTFPIYSGGDDNRHRVLVVFREFSYWDRDQKEFKNVGILDSQLISVLGPVGPFSPLGRNPEGIHMNRTLKLQWIMEVTYNCK